MQERREASNQNVHRPWDLGKEGGQVAARTKKGKSQAMVL